MRRQLARKIAKTLDAMPEPEPAAADRQPLQVERARPPRRRATNRRRARFRSWLARRERRGRISNRKTKPTFRIIEKLDRHGNVIDEEIPDKLKNP